MLITQSHNPPTLFDFTSKLATVNYGFDKNT